MTGKAYVTLLFGSLGLSLIIFLSHVHDQSVSLLQSRPRRAASDFIIALQWTDQHHADFVNKHNELRRSVNPSASNMLMMTWDTELQALAAAHTAKCLFSHSSGLQTSVFPFVGENLRIAANTDDADLMPNETTQAWFDEVSYYTYGTGACQAGKECGHYKQVVWAETYKIGCAASFCKNVFGSDNGFIISCNYGVAGDTASSKVPYRNGTSCSACPVTDTCKNKLCTNLARDTTTNTGLFANQTCDIALCGGPFVATACINTTGENICICKQPQNSLQTNQTRICNGFTTVNVSPIYCILIALLIWACLV
uniref:GLIPR1-like protein 1 isoform X2 n=1 Tax=Ciona intestinalis TaxID=7719 RepID=UPI000EF4757B|nr:GLIPR1-like protein 1 isoform X2 [Ciona intestinalis]|eukprot:XP_026690754.1 GLIPR1-like protein 1 isoform X2 [Ciona intestinalis]